MNNTNMSNKKHSRISFSKIKQFLNSQSNPTQYNSYKNFQQKKIALLNTPIKVLYNDEIDYFS